MRRLTPLDYNRHRRGDPAFKPPRSNRSHAWSIVFGLNLPAWYAWTRGDWESVSSVQTAVRITEAWHASLYED